MGVGTAQGNDAVVKAGVENVVLAVSRCRLSLKCSGKDGFYGEM